MGTLDLMDLEGSRLDIKEVTGDFWNPWGDVYLEKRVGYGTSQIAYTTTQHYKSAVVKIIDRYSEGIVKPYNLVFLHSRILSLKSAGIPLPKLVGFIKGTIGEEMVYGTVQSKLDIYIEDSIPSSEIPDLSSFGDKADFIRRGFFQLTDKSVVFGDWLPYIKAITK